MSAPGGGGGSQPLSILFQILGLDKVKPQISAVATEVTKVGTAADSAGKKVGTMADSVTKTGAAGSGLKPISDNLTKIDKSATTAAGSTTKVQQSMDKTKTSVAGFTSASNQSASSVEKLRTGHEGLATSGTKASTSQDKVSKSTTDVKSSADQASTSTTKAAKSQDDLSTSSGKTSGSLDKEKGSLKGVGDESKNADVGLTKVKGTTDQVGGSSEQASTKQGTLRSSFTSTMGAAASLGGGITSLWQTYDSLGDAQLRVDKATNTLHATQLKIQVLQDKLNKLTTEGKEGTDEYALVQDKLQLAQDKLTATEGTLTNAQEDLNITNAEFYQRIIPETITVLGSLTTLLSNSGGLLGKFKEGLSALSLETIKTSKVMSLISLTNPFFLAITIGGGIIAAFVSNLFGFRDAINGVGVALGNALGPLKPFLTMIGDLGKGLVDALGMGGDATKAYAADTETSMDTATDAVGGHQTAVVSAFEQQHQALVQANLAAAGYTTDFTTNMATASKAPVGLSDAVARAMEGSKRSLAEIVKDTIATSKALKDEFSKSFNLQGIEISGLPKETKPPQKLGTGTDKLKDMPLGGGVKGMVSNLGLQVVDDQAGHLIGNLNALAAALKAMGATGEQEAVVWDTLTNKMGVMFYSTSRNINQTGQFDEILKQLQPDLTGAADGTTDLGKAQSGTAGSTKGMDNALKKATGGLQAATDGTKKYVGGQKILKDMQDSAAEDLASYTEILRSEGMMHDVAAAGVQRQQAAMAKAQVDVIANTAASAEYSKQLGTVAGQNLEVEQGMLKQNDAFNQAKATMLQNVGVLAVLSDSTKLADAKNVAFADGILTTEIALKNQQIATEGVKGEIMALISEQIRGEAQTTAYNKGFFEQEKQFQLDKIAIFETTGKIAAMHLEYERGEAQVLAYNKGLTAQQLAFEEDKLKADELRGTIEALNEAGASGQAQIVAFNNAYMEQELAFTKSKTKADELRATVAAMQKEYDVASVIAYTSAFQDQNKKFEENRLQVDAMVGTILSLQSHYDDGRASQLAFTQGTREQEIAFQNSKTAIDQLEGTIATMISHYNDGQAQVVAFNQGMYEQRKATLEAYEGIFKVEGGVVEYHTAVQAGLPQVTAFANAFYAQAKAQDEMQVATAGTLGTISQLSKQLSDFDSSIIRFNSGFATGYKSILDWAAGVAVARGEASGAQSAFDDFAGSLGETLPEGFNASLDAQKTFVEAMAGVPDVVQGIADQMAQKGEAMASSLAESFKKGQEGVDEAFDGLGEKVGFKIDQEMRDGLNAAMVAATLKGQLEAGFTLLHAQDFARNPGAFAKVAAGITGDIQDAIAKDPNLATMGEPIIKAIQDLKMNPNEATLWTQLEQLIANFKTQVGGAAVVQNSLTEAQKNPEGVDGQIKNLGTANQALENYNKAIAASQKTVETYQSILGHMWDNAGKPAGPGQFDFDALQGTAADKSTPAKPKGGADPFAAQMQSGEAFKTMLTQIQTLAQTTATGITTAFTTMGTTFGTTVTTMAQAAGVSATTIGVSFAAGFQQVSLYATTMITNFGTTVTQMAQASAVAATLIGTSFATGFQQAEMFANTSMQAINTMATGVATGMKTVGTIAGTAIAVGFQQGEKYALTALQSILTKGVALGTGMKQPMAVAGTAIATGFQQGEKFANTSLQAILRMATLSFPKIGQAAATAGKAIGTGIQAGANAANQAMSSMVSKASSTFNSISRSADNATRSVKGLASAINSLKNKTVTITTVYVTRHVTAAKGFGPAVIQNATNFTAGEAGPELVSVIPLTQTGMAAPGGTNTSTSITNNVSSSSSPFSRTGISNVFGGSMNSVNNTTSTTASQQNTVLNRFNESVSRISKTYDRQETRMSSSIQNISSVGNPTNPSGSGAGIPGVTNYNNTTNVPNNVSSVRNGNVYNTGGGNGNGSVEGIVAMVKDIITSAFAQTTINVTSQSIMDSDLVYEKQKKQFGIKNGSVLK